MSHFCIFNSNFFRFGNFQKIFQFDLIFQNTQKLSFENDVIKFIFVDR